MNEVEKETVLGKCPWKIRKKKKKKIRAPRSGLGVKEGFPKEAKCTVSLYTSVASDKDATKTSINEKRK